MDMWEAGDPDGTWTDIPEGTYIAHHVVPQQPLMILQQFPETVGGLTQPVRPQRVRGDLIELLMIQNSQMHQVVMNSLVVSALISFGLGPSPSSAQMTLVLRHTDGEEEAMVFHHHYVPYLSTGALMALPVPTPAQAQGPAAVRYLGPVSAVNNGEVSVVPPPPPPSATGTVGANVPPASEYYDFEEGRL